MPKRHATATIHMKVEQPLRQGLSNKNVDVRAVSLAGVELRLVVARTGIALFKGKARTPLADIGWDELLARLS